MAICVFRKKFGYVLGIDWRHAENKSSATEIAKEMRHSLKESGETPIVISYPDFVMEDGSYYVGVVSKTILKDAGKRTVYAAAPLVASVIQDGVVIMDLPQGGYWLLLAHKGGVAPRHDVIVSGRSQMEEILERWTTEFGSLELYGTTTGATLGIEAIWTEIEERLAQKEALPSKVVRAICLQGGSHEAIRLAVGILVGAWVLGSSYWLYDFWKKSRQPVPEVVTPSVPVIPLPQGETEEQRRARVEPGLREQFRAAVETKRTALFVQDGATELRVLLESLHRVGMPRGSVLQQCQCTRGQTDAKSVSVQFQCSLAVNVPPDIPMSVAYRQGGHGWEITPNSWEARKKLEISVGIVGRPRPTPMSMEVWRDYGVHYLKLPQTGIVWGGAQTEAVLASQFAAEGITLREKDVVFGKTWNIQMQAPFSDVWKIEKLLRLKQSGVKSLSILGDTVSVQATIFEPATEEAEHHAR